MPTNAITVPNQANVRRTTDLGMPMNGHALPSMIANSAMTNVGPIGVSSAGPVANGQAQVEEISGNRAPAYLGMNLDGAVAAGQPVSPQRHFIADGFASVSPGAPVYVDNAANASSGATTSGLTHNNSSGVQVGVGLTTTRIFFL